MKKTVAGFVAIFFLVCLLLPFSPCIQSVSDADLNRLEEEINSLLKKGGHDYLTTIITTDEKGEVKIQVYFLMELGNIEYPSKMTLVATLVGNLTADRNWPQSRLIFFETHKDIFGWITIKDCWEAAEIDSFQERIEFILSRLKRD